VPGERQYFDSLPDQIINDLTKAETLQEILKAFDQLVRLQTVLYQSKQLNLDNTQQCVLVIVLPCDGALEIVGVIINILML